MLDLFANFRCHGWAMSLFPSYQRPLIVDFPSFFQISHGISRDPPGLTSCTSSKHLQTSPSNSPMFGVISKWKRIIYIYIAYESYIILYICVCDSLSLSLYLYIYIYMMCVCVCLAYMKVFLDQSAKPSTMSCYFYFFGVKAIAMQSTCFDGQEKRYLQLKWLASACVGYMLAILPSFLIP